MNNEEKLKAAKRLYTTATPDQKYVLESLFPELAESEDERIRKALIQYIKNWKANIQGEAYPYLWSSDEEECNKLLAWLEKQKKPEDMVHITELKVWPANSATAANRQLYNRVILKILSNYVEKYPDIRFGQMLFNLGVKPHFNQESKETYCNLNETINKKS